MKKILRLCLALCLLLVLFGGCSQPRFRFVFLTDIHLDHQQDAVKALETVISHVNGLKPRPDFVITGGDHIMDALGENYETADSLYTLYLSMIQDFRMPVYNCMGNHEMFGVYKESGVSPDHPEYGKKMFQNRIGNGTTYRSFDHKGWHFVLLDGVSITEDRKYTGHVDSDQLLWLKEDLLKNQGKPVVMATHIPLISVRVQFDEGALAPNEPGLVIDNSKDVLDICRDHALKLVLQGHLHILEEIGWKDTRFITGGAVSGRWWRGPYQGFEEGYIIVDVRGDRITWKFEDYGWKEQR